jgi:flagellar motor protein MotB
LSQTEDGYVLNLPGPLLFDTGSDVLNDSTRTRLAQLAKDLHALSITRLRLFGHTDNVGSADMNRGLSSRRAEAVAAQQWRITVLRRKILNAAASALIARSPAMTLPRGVPAIAGLP